MPSFEITEVQIDNYNETNNQLNRFESGLNIICGPNEAGKSTLMTFIKNLLTSAKSEASGYMKCKLGKKTFQLNADKKSKTDNENALKGIITPTYKTGFIINLDDIVYAKHTDADELINIVKDSSGNTINKKQSEIETSIYGKKQKFSLTSSNKASTDFKKQFDNLKNIDNKIAELQTKEEEYNNICAELENIENNLVLQKNKLDYAEKIYQKQTLEEEINELVFNQKLFDNKSNFDKLREKAGAINADKIRLDSLKSKLENHNDEFNKKLNDLNKYQSFKKEQVKSFDVNVDDLKLANEILNKSKELENKNIELEKNIKSTQEKINEQKLQIDKKTDELNKIGITNLEEYIDDKTLCEKYKENHTRLLDEYRSSEQNKIGTKFNYPQLFGLLFISMLCISIAILMNNWHSPMRMLFVPMILVSIVGINTCIMLHLENKKKNPKDFCSDELNKNNKYIKAIFKKYNYGFKENQNLLVVTNSFLQKMNEKISEYKSLQNILNTLNENYENEHKKLEKYYVEKDETIKLTENIQKEQKDFLNRTSVTSLENFSLIYDFMRDLQNLLSGIENLEKEINEIEKNISDFIPEVNNFIQECDLISFQTVNIYDDLDNVFTEIRQILDKTIECNTAKTKNLEQITKLNSDLNIYSENIKSELKEITQEKLNELESDLNYLNEEKGRKKALKDELETVSDLVELKNKRNIEINRLKQELNKLMTKEIVYNVIEKTKEKFNETQPNLINAKKYLEKITDNKYNNIDCDNKIISGENTADKNWNELSRGTKEQLYLALRLGFASNFSKEINGESNGLPELPLIIDDAFVNFDKTRTTAVIKCMEEFAKTNQVLFFTCHSQIITEILASENIKYNLINL